ncbi:signal transduction histidine kinase [Rubricella aquisinus]|uniref:histidine kinase n=1 Tax=Rubricella aquisinus TaxID=2028108 RepID=A0A840WXD7_9RHOB|nr:signal transduction histidine kinase [Rubricella aquisinus]
MRRQKSVLAADFRGRGAASIAAFILTAVILGPEIPLIFGTIYFMLELYQPRHFERLEDRPTSLNYAFLLINGFLMMAVFSLPAVFVWQVDGFTPKLTAVVYLVATQMHVVLVRSTHIPFGVFNMIPMIVGYYVLLYLYHLEGGAMWELQFGVIGCTILNGYFIFAMVLNNRVARDLAAARHKAEAANAAKSQFLSAMSHELRTPLNGIIGIGQLIAEDPHHPDQPERAARLIQSARALQRIVDDVLDLTRVEQGRVRLEPETVRLRDEICALVHLYEPEARERGLRLHADVAENLPEYVHLDPVRLRQILGNLMSNAVKFTVKGEVGLFVMRGPDSQLVIRVSDTGIGIPAQTLPNIFTAFYQQDHGTSAMMRRGTGLGLTICQDLAHLMGGQITVESTEGVGTTFTLELPLVATERPADVTSPAPAIPALPQGLTILVVDDTPTNLMVTSALLSSQGFDIHEARSGKDALDQLTSLKAAVVLMDVNMPEMDGVEAFRQIRARNNPVPVIALTADAMAGDEQRYLDLGFDGYLPKPVGRDQMIQEISRVLA